MASLLRIAVCLGLLWGGWGGAWANTPRTPYGLEPGTVLRYGVYDNAPKLFWDSQGRAAGIWPDLLNALAADRGWRLEPVPCEWTRCLAMVEQGELDFMPDVAWAAERQQRFDFHQTPVFYSWSQLYIRPGQPLVSLLDLAGRSIAVLQGSVQEQFLRDTLQAFGVEPTWVLVDSLVTAFDLLERGEVDAAVANRFYGDQQAVLRRLVGSAVVFQPAQLFVVTPRGQHPELLGAIDAQMAQWRADPDSVYFRTLSHWAGADGATEGIPVVVFWILGGAASLTLFAMLVSVWLRRQVRLVTADLSKSRDQLNTILDGVGAAVFIKDCQGAYQYANRAALDILKTDLVDLVGRKDGDFFDPETAARLRVNDQRVLQTGEKLIEEETNRMLDECEVHSALTVKMPLRNERGEIYALCGISTDLTAFRKAEQAIDALTHYDPLTRLPNRRLLMDRLQQSLLAYQRSHHDGAVLLVDIDGFSLLNNTMGYETGDALLRQVAERLSAQVRAEDTLARLSSDEFVLLLHDLSGQPTEAAEQAQRVLEKIRLQFETPFEIHGHPHITSACVGVALFSDAADSSDDLLKLADLALHQAKQMGRGSMVFFNPAMQAHARQKAQLEADLRRALAEQQFVLEYQPQVNEAGQVLGVEALVRWQHPERGRVLPGQFIGLAEASGMILPLGRWILEAACRQLVAWADHPLMSRWVMAVNVSARQFRQDGFVQEVLDILAQTGANPQRLELELTESLLVDDLPTVTAKMSELSRHGVHLALDDFGTGYSSLNYLRQFPLNRLKIDKSFVDEVTAGSSEAAIVKTIVTLAQALNLSVIAEGVETADQWQALQVLGVRHAQGFMFSQAVPADQLALAYTPLKERL